MIPVSAGLEPILSHTKKSCVALAPFYRQFSTNINIKIIRLNFNIRGKLSIIQCNK